MTKGEYLFSGDEPEETKYEKEKVLPSQEELNDAVIFRGYEITNDNVFSDEKNNNNFENKQLSKYFGISNQGIEQVVFSNKPLADVEKLNNNGQHIDIIEYVNNVQNHDVRRKLKRLLSYGLDESEIDIENMDNYLVVAHTTNSKGTLELCENKLIEHINHANCEEFDKIAEHYDLQNLRTVANIFIKDKSGKSSCPSAPYQTDYDNNNLPLPEKTYKHKTHENYYAIFTCGKCKSNRTVTVMVYDQSFKMKSYRNLQKGTNISKQFECCCLQTDEDIEPYIFWCFGKSVYRYDPLMLKCKERASLRCKRTKFSFVTLSDNCYVIGGEYQMHRVYEIEEYSCSERKWTKVAMLPRECLPIGCSCVVFNNCVYIFSAMVDESNEIKRHSTGVYLFHPVRKTVKQVAEIPFRFNQIKSCVLDSFIYLASDKGLFIRFNPTDQSVIRCQDQILVCRDFGMFSSDGAVICVGGKSAEDTSNDIFRRYSTSSETWDILPTTLPDCMSICGVCELKIPKSAGGIIPFYDKNIFGK